MKKKNNLAIVLSVLFFMLDSITAHAGSVGPYSGKVLDNTTGEPIPGASILLIWNIYEGTIDCRLVYSNEQGEYSIPNISTGFFASVGRETLIIYAFGYDAYILDMSSDRAIRFQSKGNTVRLTRTTAEFDHTRLYEKILYVLDQEPEKSTQDPYRGTPLEMFVGPLPPIRLSDLFHKKPPPKPLLFITMDHTGAWRYVIPEKKPMSIRDLRRLEKKVKHGDISLQLFGEYCEWERYKNIPYNTKGLYPHTPMENLPEFMNAHAQALHHNDPIVRNAALRSIGATKEPLLATIVIPSLNDPTPLVRHNAVTALGRIDAKQALDPLLKLVMEQNVPWPQPIIQQEALKSIGFIASDKTVIRKVNHVTEPGTDPETKSLIIQSLTQRLDDAYLKDDIIDVIRICEPMKIEKRKNRVINSYGTQNPPDRNTLYPAPFQRPRGLHERQSPR